VNTRARIFVRCVRGLERLDETALRAAPEVRVPMRALLGTMPELGLHRLHGLAVRDGLARHRVPSQLVMGEHPEPELLLHEPQRSHVAVDVARERACLGEEELFARVQSCM